MKWLLIGFIIIQIGINLAHSVTVFPFVHYGMFSESFRQPDSLTVYQVTVNGKLLQARDFRVYRWDMIQSPLAASEAREASRDFAFDREKMGEGLQKIGLGGFFRTVEPQMRNDSADLAGFQTWYQRYLSGLLGYPVNSLRVEKVWYRWRAGQMQSCRTEIRINR